jgi:hypothetical protein
VNEPTREQIAKKWRTLGEGWEFAERDTALMACLETWARTDWTLKDVATKYSEHQAAAVACLLDFNPTAGATIKAMWPVWRTQSERIEDDRWYQASEALNVCAAVHHLHGIAFRMRVDHDRLLPPPPIVITREQSEDLGLKLPPRHETAIPTEPV